MKYKASGEYMDPSSHARENLKFTLSNLRTYMLSDMD